MKADGLLHLLLPAEVNPYGVVQRIPYGDVIQCPHILVGGVGV